MRRVTLATALFTILTIATACGGTNAFPSGPRVLERLDLLTPDTVRVAPGDTITPITVVARDGSGAGMPGVQILAHTDAGSVAPLTGRTDELGRIDFAWVIPPTAGTYTLTIETAVGGHTVQVVALAGQQSGHSRMISDGWCERSRGTRRHPWPHRRRRLALIGRS